MRVRLLTKPVPDVTDGSKLTAYRASDRTPALQAAACTAHRAQHTAHSAEHAPVEEAEGGVEAVLAACRPHQPVEPARLPHTSNGRSVAAARRSGMLGSAGTHSPEGHHGDHARRRAGRPAREDELLWERRLQHRQPVRLDAVRGKHGAKRSLHACRTAQHRQHKDGVCVCGGAAGPRRAMQAEPASQPLPQL